MRRESGVVHLYLSIPLSATVFCAISPPLAVWFTHISGSHVVLPLRGWPSWVAIGFHQLLNFIGSYLVVRVGRASRRVQRPRDVRCGFDRVALDGSHHLAARVSRRLGR
jgi:hypothetical protein